MSSTRRKYTREFKIEAAKLSYNSDKPVEAIAEKLGVSQSSLNRWRREFGTDPDQAFPGNGQRKERDVEVSQLKRELKYQFIEAHRYQYPVMLMCRMLAVARSGYYEWRKQPFSAQKMADLLLLMHIQDIFTESQDTYGSYRIQAELAEQGLRCGRKRVARLMRVYKLVPKTVRPFKVVTTDSNHNQPVAPNRLNQQFSADRPDQIWLTDITYVPTAEGWLYLAVVLDLYSRRIVGWAMRDSLHRQLVLDALQMALAVRQPPLGLLHHSDQGSQYASDDYQALLTQAKMVASMSHKGNCYDNAPVESFFGTLKTELVFHRQYVTHAQARLDIFEYIELFYNRFRRHSALGYICPVKFEALPLGT